MSSPSSWSWRRSSGLTLALVGTAGVVAALAAVGFVRSRRAERRRRTLLGDLCCERLQLQVCHDRGRGRVTLVQSNKDWEQIRNSFLEELARDPVMGFDCEWVTRNKEEGGQGRISLVQMTTCKGWNVLVRLCKMAEWEVPTTLAEILTDGNIVKLGVGIQEDSKKFEVDFGIPVLGFVDLRHLLRHARPGQYIKKTGLAGLAKEFLGVNMDKEWRIRAGDWEAEELSSRQLDYAANDSLAGINIGLSMAVQILDGKMSYFGSKETEAELYHELYQLCRPFADVPIRVKARPPKEKKPAGANGQTGGGGASSSRKEKQKRFSLRQSPLYHNCKLEAPDGQPLCVCDTKKAEWYIAKGLADKVCDDPFTARLRFEPAGRPEGAAGEYYLTFKENQCAVCGRGESYLRKYVVPHEYRKHFPDVMRDHSSHDVLLTCHPCHTRSNLLDLNLRRELAEECDAPIGTEEDVKVREDQELRAVKSAARALLKDRAAGKIPEGRAAELRKVVRDFFSAETDGDVTGKMLTRAAELDST